MRATQNRHLIVGGQSGRRNEQEQDKASLLFDVALQQECVFQIGKPGFDQSFAPVYSPFHLVGRYDFLRLKFRVVRLGSR